MKYYVGFVVVVILYTTGKVSINYSRILLNLDTFEQVEMEIDSTRIYSGGGAYTKGFYGYSSQYPQIIIDLKLDQVSDNHKYKVWYSECCRHVHIVDKTNMFPKSPIVKGLITNIIVIVITLFLSFFLSRTKS